MNEADLLSEICAERDWRLREIDFYKKIPHFYANSLFNRHTDKYFKMCIPMLYAHWEGFIISAFRLLSEYINSQNVQYDKAQECIILLANKKRFEYLKGNCSIEQQQRFLQEFLQNQSVGIRIPAESCVSANSNLNFEQFERILKSFNMQVTVTFNNNRRNIEKLVTFRNKIAHGENSIIVKQEDVDVLVHCVNEMIDESIIVIKNYVLIKEYKLV